MKTWIKTFWVFLLVGQGLFGFSCKDKVYIYEGHIDFKYPWYVFFDWTARIDNPGYTESERIKIASHGSGIWPMFRAFDEKGAGEIRAITTINPDFIPICYYGVMSVLVDDPGEDSGFDHDLYDLLKDHVAHHIDGEPVLCWPPPSEGDPFTYWHSTLPATGGKSFNWNLMKHLLDVFEDYMIDYPGVCKGIFLDFYMVDGPYVHPAEFSLHGAVDMDGDSIAFDDDENEKTSWIEWEREFSRQLSNRFGHAFIQLPNGRAVHPGFSDSDEELARAANGAVFENFPTTPWGYNGAKAVDQLYQMYSSEWFRNVHGHKWFLLFQTLATDDWSHQMTRISSLVFLVPYAFAATSESNVVFEDPYTIDAGTPAGDLVVEEEGDTVTFSRQFTNGIAKIIVNKAAGTATPSWTPN